MNLFSAFLSNVSNSTIKFILLIFNKIKGMLLMNLPRVNKNYLIDIFDNHLIHYSSPISLTYA